LDPVPAPVSPTGTPLVPSWLVPYILIALAVVGALIVGGEGSPPMVAPLAKVGGYLKVTELVLLALLGSSPGLRRPMVTLLVCCSFLCFGLASLEGCAHVTPNGQRAIDCATSNAGSLEHAPEIIAAAQSDNFVAILDSLWMTFGPIVECEVRLLIDVLKGASSSPPATDVVRANGGLNVREVARLEAWLQVHLMQ